jgi:hypothetical protein
VGHGDTISLEPFHQPQRHAFHGQLVAIVQRVPSRASCA